MTEKPRVIDYDWRARAEAIIDASAYGETKPDCLKCGFNQSVTKYEEPYRYPYNSKPGTAGPYGITPERLKVSCSRCEYYYYTKTKDQSEDSSGRE